ncbi:MAG: hypothetical protein WC179_10195 [Candidatus Cloacimonadaceae bacterium]|nr:hypothetical protein [Bacteroidales bacterium]MDD3011959.1 hypothetical protein [Bacteroidales bacterium]MDD3961598.1 hypothetical protein [Bacteroidales bacterium]NCD42861.1 hypothetical protein [Bacteroidia bacterium]
MKKSKIQNFIFVCIVLMMILPLMQQITGFPNVASLKGYFVKPLKPYLSASNLFTGSYQDSLNKYLENNIGYRPDLVRINNTVDYYLYNKLNTNNVILGKQNYTFEDGYINATLGRDFVGEEKIYTVVKKAKAIQDYLFERDITFILVFAPGKATFFPEFIPDIYHPDSITTTNIEVYREKVNEFNVNVIDYNDWFVSMKDTTNYPLYPQYGIHWSYYGMILALDSLAHYIERNRDIDMIEMDWDRIDISRNFKDTDYDLGKALNLLWKLPTFKMAYPHLVFEKEEGKVMPSLLAVSDSYFWNWYGTGFTSRLFRQTNFLYYFNQYYSSDFSGSKKISDIDLLSFVEGHEVVIVMATDGNLKTYAFGFIENLYNEIFNSNERELVITWNNEKYTLNSSPQEWKILKGTPGFETVLKCNEPGLEPNTTYTITYEAKGFSILEMDFYPYSYIPVYVNTEILPEEYSDFSWEFTTDNSPDKAELRIYMDYRDSFTMDTYIRNLRIIKSNN